MILNPTNLAIWAIAALATAGVIARPFKLPEAVWAVVGRRSCSSSWVCCRGAPD